MKIRPLPTARWGLALAISLLVTGTMNPVLADAQEVPPHEAMGRQRVTERPDGAPVPIERSHVCFVNDTYMGTTQIPVSVDGKTYYGCCRGCVDRLHSESSTRFATDPHTGKRVDKATAFIAFESARSPKVLYFESAESHDTYRNGEP